MHLMPNPVETVSTISLLLLVSMEKLKSVSLVTLSKKAAVTIYGRSYHKMELL